MRRTRRLRRPYGRGRRSQLGSARAARSPQAGAAQAHRIQAAQAHPQTHRPGLHPLQELRREAAGHVLQSLRAVCTRHRAALLEIHPAIFRERLPVRQQGVADALVALPPPGAADLRVQRREDQLLRPSLPALHVHLGDLLHALLHVRVGHCPTQRPGDRAPAAAPARHGPDAAAQRGAAARHVRLPVRRDGLRRDARAEGDPDGGTAAGQIAVRRPARADDDTPAAAAARLVSLPHDTQRARPGEPHGRPADDRPLQPRRRIAGLQRPGRRRGRPPGGARS